MTDAFDPVTVDYARAIEEATAFLARPATPCEGATTGGWIVWALSQAPAELKPRYPMAELDPARRRAA